MSELLKKFIDKKCVIYFFSSTEKVGIIKEVVDDGLLLEDCKDNSLQVIAIKYITRVREYPKDKNGKDKKIILS